MNKENQHETFAYSYSAKEQEEIQRIRSKYQPRQESKLEQLRRLDASVTQKGTVWALVVGILGALLMGSGMSLVMTDLGAALGISRPILPGILIGILGIAGVALAYPVYGRVTKKERERLAPAILQLTDELSR